MTSQVVKNHLPMQETQVRSLGWEDPLQKEMATHSSILAWEIPRTEELGGLLCMGSQRVGHDLATKQQVCYTFFHMGFDPSSSLSGFLGHFSKFLFMFFLFFLSHLSLYLSTHFHRFTSLEVKLDVK